MKTASVFDCNKMNFFMRYDLMFFQIGFTLQDFYMICSYESNNLCRVFSIDSNPTQFLYKSYQSKEPLREARFCLRHGGPPRVVGWPLGKVKVVQAKSIFKGTPTKSCGETIMNEYVCNWFRNPLAIWATVAISPTSLLQLSSRPRLILGATPCKRSFVSGTAQLLHITVLMFIEAVAPDN
jgi:hypothetical protein